ncbi:hypothetical protein KIW84_022922 [Lathyrus oleraceus]|uniref:DUF7745 domain-containing protein n=1 Tax=Pisum sativum TaxID=3888 RepID=A0A9D4YFI8_PEA|nr:hypothetical protein KIW84_022922 [Pisum sativum]
MDLLTTYVDVSTLVALSQYYDPPLRCFTFKDFQLVPTIEEYEMLLGSYMKDHLPFTSLGEQLTSESVVEVLHITVEEVTLGLGPRELSKKFLEEKAWTLKKEGKWLPFSLGSENPDLLQKIKRACNLIHYKGKELGKRDCRAKELYHQWVVQRVKEIKLTYNVEVLVPSPEPEHVYASKEEVDALRETIT